MATPSYPQTSRARQSNRRQHLFDGRGIATTRHGSWFIAEFIEIYALVILSVEMSTPAKRKAPATIAVEKKRAKKKARQNEATEKDNEEEACICFSVLGIRCEADGPLRKCAIVTDMGGRKYPEFLWCPHCKCASTQLWWQHHYGTSSMPADWAGFACCDRVPIGMRHCDDECVYVPREMKDDQDDEDEEDNEQKDRKPSPSKPGLSDSKSKKDPVDPKKKQHNSPSAAVGKKKRNKRKSTDRRIAAKCPHGNSPEDDRDGHCEPPDVLCENCFRDPGDTFPDA
jgi:hypothetical protein